jgi:DNA-binding transcriptional ArsR family regulator
MSIESQAPDYDLADEVVVSSPGKLRAMADPLRSTLLDLLLERAATVTELAAAVGRPKSTVAHHVNVLVDAELVRVVRTRRVRAIEERYYGRTSRLFRVGVISRSDGRPEIAFGNDLSVAATEAGPAHDADDLRSIFRHARVPADRVDEFWERVIDLSHEFARLPRSGETVYAFVAALYPTDHPSLPGSTADSAGPDA